MRICRAATKIVHPWHLSTYTEPLTGPQSTVQFVSSSSRNAPKLSHLRSLRVTSREREWPRGSNSQGDGAAVEPRLERRRREGLRAEHEPFPLPAPKTLSWGEEQERFASPEVAAVRAASV